MIPLTPEQIAGYRDDQRTAEIIRHLAAETRPMGALASLTVADALCLAGTLLAAQAAVDTQQARVAVLSARLASRSISRRSVVED